MRRTINIYIDRPQNHTLLTGGRLVGQLSVDNNTTLQSIGASVYDYVRENNLTDYGTYKIIFSGDYERPTTGYRGIVMQESVEMLLPNDIYVPGFEGLTVSNLDHKLVNTNLRSNIRLDIEPKLEDGLSKYYVEADRFPPQTPFPRLTHGQTPLPGQTPGLTPFPGQTQGMTPFPRLTPFPGQTQGMTPFLGQAQGMTLFPGQTQFRRQIPSPPLTRGQPLFPHQTHFQGPVGIDGKMPPAVT